jgi:hypothetical protein
MGTCGVRVGVTIVGGNFHWFWVLSAKLPIFRSRQEVLAREGRVRPECMSEERLAEAGRLLEVTERSQYDRVLTRTNHETFGNAARWFCNHPEVIALA